MPRWWKVSIMTWIHYQWHKDVASSWCVTELERAGFRHPTVIRCPPPTLLQPHGPTTWGRMHLINYCRATHTHLTHDGNCNIGLTTQNPTIKKIADMAFFDQAYTEIIKSCNLDHPDSLKTHIMTAAKIRILQCSSLHGTISCTCADQS